MCVVVLVAFKSALVIPQSWNTQNTVYLCRDKVDVLSNKQDYLSMPGSLNHKFKSGTVKYLQELCSIPRTHTWEGRGRGGERGRERKKSKKRLDVVAAVGKGKLAGHWNSLAGQPTLLGEREDGA